MNIDETTKQATDESLAKVTRKLKTMMEHCENQVQKFEKNLKKDPRYAFEWSETAMKCAAAESVYRHVYMALTEDNPTDLVKMREYAIRETTRMARSPESSTSTTSNLMDRFELAAWAEVFEMIDNTFRYGSPS